VARSADFILLRRNGTRIWLPQGSVEAAVLNALEDPDDFFKRGECRIIKDQKKIRVARVALTMSGVSTSVYVKRYNAFSWRYKLASLFFRSGALRSLRGAMILAHAGVRTAKPLAALESRCWGLLSRGFYISEEIVSGQTCDRYWRDNLRPLSSVTGVRRRRRFLHNLACLFFKLHAAGVYHNDLKDANILVTSGPDGNEVFYFLDLDGVRDCFYLSGRRRVKNLVQLNRTLGRFLSRSEKLYWLRHYLGEGFERRSVRRWWAQRIQRATRRADRRSRAKNRRALVR
jgi:serine/threonine protein kinase